jgi:hypothetical protein
MATYGKSEADCAEILDHIPVIHLHGRMGFLPWNSQRDVVPYGAGLDAQRLDTCIRKIRWFTKT